MMLISYCCQILNSQSAIVKLYKLSLEIRPTCTCSLGGFIQASLPRLSHTRARSRVSLSIASREGGIQVVI